MTKRDLFFANFEPYRYRRTAQWKGELITRFVKGRRLLDAGCGNGWVSRFFRQHGYRVIGVDVSDHVLQMNRLYSRLSKTRPIKIVKASLVNLPFRSASFDTIVAAEVLEHLSSRDLKRALAEFARVLAPSGRLIITVPTPLYNFVYDRLLHSLTHGSKIDYATRVAASIQDLAPNFRYVMEGPDVHHQQFRVQSLKRILKNAGFDIIAIRNAEVITPFFRSLDNLVGLPKPILRLLEVIEWLLVQVTPKAAATDWLFVAERP